MAGTSKKHILVKLVTVRDDPFQPDIKTDLFALRCTMYFIMMGQTVFPDIIDGADGWYDRVASRFAMEHFPHDSHACSGITFKCWLRQFGIAEDIVGQMEAIEKRFAITSDE